MVFFSLAVLELVWFTNGNENKIQINFSDLDFKMIWVAILFFQQNTYEHTEKDFKKACQH